VKWELTTDDYGRCQVSKISHVMCLEAGFAENDFVNAMKKY